ncbi:MAG: hypothetical protein NT169_13575 [Chloroflexi bacterium]|nr:hypothetical protein [Chloroflexota bacterium]
MNKTQLFEFLETYSPSALLSLLSAAYDAMGHDQRQDEIGSWMIPGDERQIIAVYMTALAATATPDEFTVAALPLIQRDSWQSFTTQAYASAVRVASEAQRTHLETEIQRQKVKTG